MQLKLATSRQFNGNELACYTEENPDTPQEKWEFWATREQIGKFLGYANPRKAIKDIHTRNRERLDKFSKSVNLRKYFNGAQNEPPFRNEPVATVYSFRGLLEICRFSNQPNANKVIDILWDIAYEISQTGYYAIPAVKSQLDAMRQENSLLRQQVDLLQAQNKGLKKYIEDNSSFTLLGQCITPVKGVLSVGEVAKLFAQNGIKIGQNRLFKKAREKKLLARRKGRQHNQPTQWAIDKGYCVLLVPVGLKGTPYLTMKGMQFLANELAMEQLPLLKLIADCEALNE